jgi:hypothetical protein
MSKSKESIGHKQHMGCMRNSGNGFSSSFYEQKVQERLHTKGKRSKWGRGRQKNREKQIIGSKQNTAKETQSSLKKTQNQLMIGIIHCRTIIVF